MHLILLILGSALLHNALSLKCYECPIGATGQCTNKQTECPQSSQCGAMRIVSYAAGNKVADMNMNSCMMSEQCIKASVNFGISATYINTKCCNTELCNTQSAPEPISSAANGKKCYTCNGQDCTSTLNCKGDEDRCISTTVDAGGQKMTMMGCASKSVCASGGIPSDMGTAMGMNVNCCEGDLCNGANSLGLGLLVLLASAVSLTLFH